MGVYRESAAPAPEIVERFPVVTRRGHALVVLLVVIAVLVGCAAFVTLFMGAPPGVEPWKWPMTAVTGAALVGAFIRHRFRRRELTIVRTGDQHHLEIAREHVRLAFPLGISGDQMTTRAGRIPIYEVFLKLVAADRKTGIFLTETRGAIHGAQKDWLTGVDRSVACDRFESGRLGVLAELRGVVEHINAKR